eukprot:25544_1
MASDMDQYLPQFKEKFELWTKFMQAGKTREMQKEIKTLAETGEDYYHIIFCSNNLFLANQTKSRIKETFETDINKTLASEFATNLNAVVFATSNNKCKHPHQLSKQFNNYRAILCCSHKRRFEQITDLLENNRKVTDKNIIIWVDEMHSDLSMSLGFLLQMSAFPEVQKIIGITATPDTIFKQIGKNDYEVRVRPMKACDDEKYYGFDDIQKQIIDIDPKEYIIPEFGPETFSDKTKYKTTESMRKSTKLANALYLNTLLKHKKIPYNHNDVFYVPGTRYKDSHYAIRDVLLSHDFYVFVFNSDGSFLYKNNNSKIKLSENRNSSLGNLMGKTKQELGLTDKPIGITGYLSVGQGNTLCDYDDEKENYEGFYITRSVYGYKTALNGRQVANDFITQVFGRCLGNLKHKNNFKGSLVYMRKQFADEIELNILSGALSELALETGITDISYNKLSKAKGMLKQGLKDGFKKLKSQNKPIQIIKFDIDKDSELMNALKKYTTGNGKKDKFKLSLDKKEIKCVQLLDLYHEKDYQIFKVWRISDTHVTDECDIFGEVKICYEQKKQTFASEFKKTVLKKHRNMNNNTIQDFVGFTEKDKSIFILCNDNGLAYAAYLE